MSEENRKDDEPAPAIMISQFECDVPGLDERRQEGGTLLVFARNGREVLEIDWDGKLIALDGGDPSVELVNALSTMLQCYGWPKGVGTIDP